MSRLEFIQCCFLIVKILRVKDEMFSIWIFFHNLTLSDNMAKNFFKAVNAESLLEDSYGFDVIGIIFGLLKE